LVLRSGVAACGDGLLIFDLAAETFPDRRRRSDWSRRGLWRRFLFLRWCRLFHPSLLARRGTALCFLDFLATFNLPIG
jgi:hypothetical protein